MRREGRVLSRTRVCVDRVGAFDDLSEGILCMPFLPNSGTTGVAHEPRSSGHDSAAHTDLLA
jgi:hypothetical protein